MKPLHYAERGGRLFFGSEIKSLLAAGRSTPTLDRAALDHYLAFLYTPRDDVDLRGVQQAAARALPALARRPERRSRRYWQIAADETFAGSEEDAADELRDAPARRRASHLVSDVPLGAFLSGGIDSSLVVGADGAARRRGR